MNPLIPDGNLTLVDDEGEQTVHFLNQVDEADLFALMDDKEAVKLKYMQIVEEPEKEPEAETPAEPEIEEPEPEKKSSVNLIPTLILLIALLAGGGFFAFKKFSGKKKR